MNKETWKKHIEETCGVIRPSHGGDKEAWKSSLSTHDVKHCKACQARAKTMRNTKWAKVNRAIYRDLGMHRVVGSESGKIYYE